MAKVALAVALLALGLSWAAYRRAGGDLGQLLSGPWNAGTSSPAEGGTDIDDARGRLERHRDEVKEDRNLDLVREDVARIREEIERSFHDAGDASDKAKAKWREVDAELERLETQLREGSAKAAGTLDSAVEKLRRWGK